MAKGMTLKVKQVGQKKFKRRLKKELNKIEGDLEKGMTFGLIALQEDVEEITPRRDGFLIGSMFTAARKARNKIVGRIGFTQKYAAIVHEMPDDTNWTKPTSESKFLEKGVERNLDKFIKVVKRYARR